MEINLTTMELKCLEIAALDPQEWLESFAKHRATQEKKKILSALMVYCNTNSIALEVGEDAQIDQALELGIVKTAAQRQEEFEATLNE